MTEKQSAHCSAVERNEGVEIGAFSVYRFVRCYEHADERKPDKEANEGKGLKVARWMRPYMTFVIPVLILCIFLMGIF